MAHELERGVYGNRTAPWHFAETGQDGRAVVVDGLLTTERALHLSGIAELEVRPCPEVYVKFGDELIRADEWQGLVRVDTRAILGIHGDGYVYDPFAEAFRSLTAGFGTDTELWETMVLLRGGRVAAGVLRLPDLDRVLPDGSHRYAYIAAFTSHDASFALTYKDTSVRIECANMLRACDGRAEGRRFTIRHTAGITDRKREAAEIITYAQRRADLAERECAELLARRITAQQVDEIIRALVIPAKGDSPQAKASRTRAERTRDGIMGLFHNAPDLADCRGTAWAAVQAFGDWSDHGARYRGADDRARAERRFINTALTGTDLATQAIPLVLAAAS